MICDFCHQQKDDVTGAVIKGEFGRACKGCITGESRLASASAAQYSRDRDREDHQRDMLQPWLGNGKINPEFAREYPDSAKDIYTAEELKEV